MSERPTNDNRDFTSSHYGDEKLDKSKELNASMSIRPQSDDALGKKMKNVTGGNDNV